MLTDPKVEQYLASMGYTWALEEKIPIERINLRLSLDNPGRLFRLEQDRVVDMAVKMGDGVQFPAIVCFKPKRPGDSYLIASGCHRYAAADLAEIATLDVYAVEEEDAYKRDLLVRTLNALEGRGYTRAEKLRQLVWLHRTYGEPIKHLASTIGISLQAAGDAVRASQVDERAQVAGLPLNERSTFSTKAVLCSLRSDQTFAEAWRLVREAQLTGEQTRSLVREVTKATKGEREELAIIESWRTRPDIKKQLRQEKADTTPTKGKARAHRFFTLGREFLGYLQSHGTTQALQLTAPEDVQEADALVIDLQEVLGRVHRMLRRGEKHAAA